MNLALVHMNYSKPSAFTLIEIVVVLFLVVVIVPAVNSVISQSVRAMAHTQREVEALYLAQEGMEAVRAYRDGDILNSGNGWQQFAALSPSNYLNEISNTIDFSISPVLIDGEYTREVIISNVCRDGSGEIITCPSGTDNGKTKRVEVIVSWEDVSGEQQVSLATYLTAFRGTGE